MTERDPIVQADDVADSDVERVIDRSLRPTALLDFVGQASIREQLEIFIGAARRRGEALDHVLIFGRFVNHRVRYLKKLGIWRRY